VVKMKRQTNRPRDIYPNLGTIVTATTNLSASFGHAFHTGIPAVATFSPESGIHYNWLALENAKLVIFTGGEDINPAIYGQPNKFSHFFPQRDTAEIEVLRRSLIMGKKMLGVCRGHQLINAYLGGILVQDITFQLNVVHNSDHNLEIVDVGGIIPNVFTTHVNSMHHQGVVKCGDGLTPTTYWKGVYESTENKDILTTQFHPEWMSEHENALGMNLWEVLATWAHLGDKIYEGVTNNVNV
jgi:putative glutamine amidotransferase